MEIYAAVLAILAGLVTADMSKDIESFQRVLRDGFSINPNPFWCNSAPQFPSCAQPAIPICCGPCYQSGGVPAVPAGGVPTGALPTGGVPTGAVPTGGAPTGGAPTGGAPTAPNTQAAGAALPDALGSPSTIQPASVPPPKAVGTTTPAAAPANTSENCPLACPAGWNTWGPFTEHCYLLPSQPAKLDTFWNQQAYCKKTEPTSYVVVVNSLTEQGLGTAVSLQYAANWFAVLTNGFIWIGGYTSPDGWKFLDGTDQTGNILMTAANVLGSKENGTCLGADPKTLGAWQTRPCSDTTGAVICEMPKRPVCGATGGILPVTPVSLTADSLKNLFPKMPSIPYLGQLLGGGSPAGSATSAPGGGILGGLLG